MLWFFFFFSVESEAFVLRESGAERREKEEEEEDEEEAATPIGGLTLRPLLALALLFVLLLEFGYQARVHVPGLRDGALLVLLYTGQHTNASGQRQQITKYLTTAAALWVVFFVVVFFPAHVARATNEGMSIMLQRHRDILPAATRLFFFFF